jgi:hypothetical protein
MKLIDISTPSHPNVFTMVDDADFEWLCQWKWKPNNSSKSWVYASRTEKTKGVKAGVLMHRLIIGAKSGECVDHINGDTLDNRRSNLRLATQSENHFNQRKRSGTSSKYKGVSWAKDKGRWRAYITFQYKRIDLGKFKTEEDAGRAYDAAAERLFGSFAQLNRVA